MKFGSMKQPGKYLAKEDLPTGKALVTVRAFTQENVGKQGQAPEVKWLIWFNEFQKAMILNSTNRQLLCLALNIDPQNGDSDSAIGRRVVLWNDMSVRGLDGNLVGGLRIRAYNPRPAAPGQAPTPIATHPQQPPAHFAGNPVPAREPGSDDGDFNDELPDNF